MKNEILETSLNQFLKYGIRDVSIQKLAELLGISTKTFYKYFKNKEELLEEALHFWHEKQHKQYERYRVDYTTVSRFFDIWFAAIEIQYDVNKLFFHDLHYYYPELDRKYEETLSKKYTKQFTQIIKKGIQEGAFQETIIAEIVFEAISVLYRGIVREGRFNSFTISPYEVLFNTIAIYIRGFSTQQGIRELDQHIEAVKTSGRVTKSKKRMVTTHLSRN